MNVILSGAKIYGGVLTNRAYQLLFRCFYQVRHVYFWLFQYAQFNRTADLLRSDSACSTMALNVSRSTMRFMKRCKAITFRSATSKAAIAEASGIPTGL
jgi:hypothetical protein